MGGMSAIIAEFLAESVENLDSVDQDIVALERDPRADVDRHPFDAQAVGDEVTFGVHERVFLFEESDVLGVADRRMGDGAELHIAMFTDEEGLGITGVQRLSPVIGHDRARGRRASAGAVPANAVVGQLECLDERELLSGN